ncbi:hypothetical protein RBU49_08040 [Clostridium sp. MB40-C1]|uniref:hypothetical protein n=1 Tax=Clostridium sp. MB40-C1 TaxID=3070996 RepID=UPI0027DFFF3C|nr:hypothetical protein [Clostridium sp. MB40-C1]WMJ82191.1 hypothetical protein RBU49_08040 [Clostridium sp. MB40-C1]
MKVRKVRCSIRGANNLSKILAEKANVRIYSLVSELYDEVVSVEKLEKITKIERYKYLS